MTEPGKETWITLGVAAALMGVSESTVRRWADSGEVRSYRTSGGHRRVREEDLRKLVAAQAQGVAPSRDTDRISDIALLRVKRQLNRRGQGHALPLEGFSDEARDRLRLLGRQLVDLFARFIASNAKGERFSADARTIGHEYGRMLVEQDVRLSVAVATFNRLRHSLEETASQIASESSLPAEDAVEAIEQTLGLADTVLEGMAEIFEARATATR
jgi:excisionase family DNA binding protein